MNECSDCRGEGIVTERHEGTVYLVPCVDCNGTGRIADSSALPVADDTSTQEQAIESAPNYDPDPDFPTEPEIMTGTHPFAYLKQAAGAAILALALIGLAPHGCTIVGTTGEGFPVAHCADGSFAYQDLDGTDGSLGTVGDGRWIVSMPMAQ